MKISNFCNATMNTVLMTGFVLGCGLGVNAIMDNIDEKAEKVTKELDGSMRYIYQNDKNAYDSLSNTLKYRNINTIEECAVIWTNEANKIKLKKVLPAMTAPIKITNLTQEQLKNLTKKIATSAYKSR